MWKGACDRIGPQECQTPGHLHPLPRAVCYDPGHLFAPFCHDLVSRHARSREDSVILTFPAAALDTVQTPEPTYRCTWHNAGLTCDCCWLHTTRPLSA